MERNAKAWLVLILSLVAFLVGSGTTEAGRDLGVTGEVYHPETLLGGILGPWGGWGGWPFRGWGGPGWVCGLLKAGTGPKDLPGGGAGYGTFPAGHGTAMGPAHDYMEQALV